MPKNNFQKTVFGLLMSYIMAYGMEVYNIAIKMGFNLKPGGLSSMTNAVFSEALKEASFMGLIVFIFSSLYGNRCGAAFANKHCREGRDNPYFYCIMRQAGTVAVMCPSMSLIASILFSVIAGGEPVYNLPAIWVGTVIKNFPMAFFWNMFAAAPLTRAVFSILFKERKKSKKS